MAEMDPELAKAAELLSRMGAAGDPQDPTVRARKRLLDAATKLFQSRGYQHTSVDEVAREAGVAKGTVYVHFKNKQELLLHAVAEEKKQLFRAFIPIITADVAPAVRLQRYFAGSRFSLQRMGPRAQLMGGGAR